MESRVVQLQKTKLSSQVEVKSLKKENSELKKKLASSEIPPKTPMAKTGTSHQWKHSVNKLHSKKEHQQIQQDEISKTRQVMITAEPKPSGNKPLILLHAELGTSLPTSLIYIASMHAPTLAVIKFETHCPPHLFVYGSPRIVALLSGLQCFFMNE